MKTALLASSLILFSTIVLTSPVFAQTMKPGMWKAKSSFKLNGLSLPASEGEECITAEEAKDPKNTISKELKKNGCELTQWKLKGKKLEAALSCKNKDVDATGKIHGTVSEKSYSLVGEAEGTYQGVLPSQATVNLDGQWVKDCK
jgi:hypothetical protein